MVEIKIKSWNGQLEDTSLQVNFSSVRDVASAPIDTIISVYEGGSAKADKIDYLIAASSGLLTAMLDVLWVGEFSLRYAQEIGTEQIEKLVIAVAKNKGCTKEDLKGCIAFLEKKYPLAADKLTSTFGGGLQHHLRDFSHHASPFGLVCSILNQFTEKGYGTDINGKMITTDLPVSDALGKTFEEKIFYGVIGWVFHLVSDMAGSSGSNGKGTGIPGPLLSLAKVLSATPLFRDLQMEYKGDSIRFSVWVSKLFNGTAFEHTSNKDIIRFDFRTELGVGNFAIKQTVPVLINQCIIRSFYFIRRLAEEYTEKNYALTDCEKLNLKEILPRRNRCIDRMITISTGVFTMVDGIDAIVHAKIKNPNDNAKILSDILLRLNFIGIGAFAFSLKNEVKYKVQDIRAFLNRKTKTQLLENGLQVEEEDIVQFIDIEVDMDNGGLYEYAFHCMYNHVKSAKKNVMQAQSVMVSMQRPILIMSDDNSQLYNAVSKLCRHSLIVETEELVMRLFTLNNISYEPFIGNEKYSYLPFVRVENGKRIAYCFSLSMTERIHDWQELKKKYDLDGIKVIAIVEMQSDIDTLDSLVCKESAITNNFVTYQPIKALFSLLGDTEYDNYKEHCEKFNSAIRELIGYSTVTIPSNEMLTAFKKNTAEVIKGFDYAQYVSELFNTQTNILNRNYFERELYRVILGESDLTESFLGSEWYFATHTTTSGLEQTAIVAGYLKSIEQLLYKIVSLSINTGKEIKKKDSRDYIAFTSENLEQADTTLGSLIGFVKYYSEIWDVNNFTRYYISDKLTEYRKKYRNHYFHKDNIYDVKEIQEIREHTIVLFYLLLGACKVSDTQIKKFNLYHEGVDIKESLKYEQLDEWLTSILGGDTLLDPDIPVFFMFKHYGQESWELQFNTVSGFDEKLFPNDMGYPYICDSLYWPAIIEEQVAEKEVVQYIEKYLEQGKYAAKLKGHSLIAVGKFEHPQIVYQKENFGR